MSPLALGDATVLSGPLAGQLGRGADAHQFEWLQWSIERIIGKINKFRANDIRPN